MGHLSEQMVLLHMNSDEDLQAQPQKPPDHAKKARKPRNQIDQVKEQQEAASMFCILYTAMQRSMSLSTVAQAQAK